MVSPDSVGDDLAGKTKALQAQHCWWSSHNDRLSPRKAVINLAIPSQGVRSSATTELIHCRQTAQQRSGGDKERCHTRNDEPSPARQPVGQRWADRRLAAYISSGFDANRLHRTGTVPKPPLRARQEIRNPCRSPHARRRSPPAPVSLTQISVPSR